MKKNKTKLKALTICLIIITAVICVCAWAAASEPHGAVTEIYTDSGGGSYTLYADGHLAINGYAGAEPEEGVFALADRVKSMELNGCTVTAESKAMFQESVNLTELSFTDTSFEGDMSRLLSGCKNLESVDMSKADMSGCINMTQLFSGCTALKHADLSDITASDKMNAYRIFENCKNLETVDMTGFNFGNTSLYAFFKDCGKLREICLKGVDTSNVTAINFMFNGCASLKSLDLSDFDTGNVTSYHDMFTGCTSLEYLDVSGFDLTDTGNMMDRMFDGLVSLKEINLEGFRTSGVTQMSYMFRNCKSLERLDLSGFDTSLVSNVGDMFTGCESLKYLDVSNFDLSRVSSLSGLFSGLSSLEYIDLSNFKVTTNSVLATNLFDGCKSLKYLDLSNVDLSRAQMYQAFNNVGFWELKLPKTMLNPFPCFSGNTPGEKPYYTWDGDWSYYMSDNSEDIVRDDILQSSSDVTSDEQICLDTVRFTNAGNAITIIANFTPIEYPVTLHDKEILKHVSYNVEKLPYTPPSEYTDKEYYIFDGFSLTEDSPVIEDFAITLEGEYRIGEISDLYMHYTPVMYDINISFVDGNGNVIATDVKKYSIEDKKVFSGLNKDYAEGMCGGYGFVGFTSEKLGISDAKELTAPEVPCGSIDVTAVMEPLEKESESLTEPPEDTNPAETEESETAEPERTTETPSEPSETETSVPEVTIPEETTRHDEPVTSKEGETERTEPETMPEDSTPTGETETPEAVTTSEEEFISETEAESASESVTDSSGVPESSEDTTKPQESEVNTGDRGGIFAVIMGAASGLCFIVYALLFCGIHRKKFIRRDIYGDKNK